MSSNDELKFMVRLKTGTEDLCRRGDIVNDSYGTRVLYDYTRLRLGLDSISLNVQIT